MIIRLFRLRQKRSDSQLSPADSEQESSASQEFQPPVEPLSDDNGDPVIESSLEQELDAEPRLDFALREVRDFLAGRVGEVSRIDPAEKVVRGAVAGALLAVISAGDSKAAAPPSNSGSGANDNNLSPASEETGDSQVQQSGGEGTDAAQAEQNRARQLFMDHGYFDEAIDSLSAAASPSERAAAARTIGMVGNRLGNVHLIAALFDDAPEVRDAATGALAQLGGSAASIAAMANPAANGGPPAPITNGIVGDGSQVEAVEQEMAADKDAASPATLDDKGVPADEAKLLLEEQAAREALEDLQQRLDDTVSARTRLEKETGLRLESEAKLSAEAAARRREEEELRQRAEDEARRRRGEEEEKLAAAHVASRKADEETRRLTQEDAMLRNEVNKLSLVAEELARTRTDMKAERAAAAERARLAETARTRQEAAATHKAEMERLRSEEEALRSAVAESALRRAEVEAARDAANRDTLRLAEEREQLAVAEAARRAEADRLRREAEERARGEQEQLLTHVEGMRRIAEEVAVRRGEVEAAREKAIGEAQRLVEAQARMKAAEESCQQAEAERLQLEEKMFQRADEERRLLDEVRLRAQEEQQQIEEGERYRAAEQEQRVAQLAGLRQRMEAEAQQRAEKERQISSQIESFRIAEMQARKRIEEAEARRRTAEDRYRLTAEKMQRVEAEARKGEMEEERILARLEEVRRNVAVATQLEVEQEKRIKDETEQLRRFEEAQRHRLEEAARGRVEAEHRWQQEKDRLQLEEDARLRASEQLKRLLNRELPETDEDAGEWRDDPAENLRPSKGVGAAEPQTTFAAAPIFAAPPASATSFASAGQGNVSNFSSAGSTGPAVYGETKSAAAQSGSNGDSAETAPASALVAPALVSEKDAFNRISARFDDPSPEVRNAAARELRELDPLRMVEWLNRALVEAPPERRQNIGSAIAASGLAAEVIDLLGGESREDTYSALCLLLTMAKGGEVRPLIQAIEEHENVYVRIAAVRLLTLNGQEEIANAAARRRLEGHK